MQARAVAGWMIVMTSLWGCSSMPGARIAGASSYAAMTCPQLNGEVTRISADISRAAVIRGRIDRTDIPNWLPGARRLGSTLADRQTAKIDQLTEQERTVIAARQSACP